MLSVDTLCNFCYGYLNNATNALCILVRLFPHYPLLSFRKYEYISASLSRSTRWRSTSLSSALGDLSPLTIQDHSDSVESLVFAFGSLAVVYSVRRTDNHRITDDNLLSVPAGWEPVLKDKLAYVRHIGYKYGCIAHSSQGIVNLLSLAADTLALVGFLIAQLADLGLFAVAQLLNVYGGNGRLDGANGLFGGIRV